MVIRCNLDNATIWVQQKMVSCFFVAESHSLIAVLIDIGLMAACVCVLVVHRTRHLLSHQRPSEQQQECEHHLHSLTFLGNFAVVLIEAFMAAGNECSKFDLLPSALSSLPSQSESIALRYCSVRLSDLISASIPLSFSCAI